MTDERKRRRKMWAGGSDREATAEDHDINRAWYRPLLKERLH